MSAGVYFDQVGTGLSSGGLIGLECERQALVTSVRPVEVGVAATATAANTAGSSGDDDNDDGDEERCGPGGSETPNNRTNNCLPLRHSRRSYSYTPRCTLHGLAARRRRRRRTTEL